MALRGDEAVWRVAHMVNSKNAYEHKFEKNDSQEAFITTWT
jgi:hypothetical protein